MPDRLKHKQKDRDPSGTRHKSPPAPASPAGLTPVSSASSTSSNTTIAAPVIPHRTQYSLILVLVPLNGTFERKTLVLPFYPEVLKLGRQTSPKNSPSSDNGFFDSRVLSRSHAEVWADRATGKVWIKDSKSSNGTYINSFRLGNEKSESEPYELKKNDTLELGIDITNDERTSFVHRKISARVERIAMMSLQAQGNDSYGANGFANGTMGPNGYQSFGQANGSAGNLARNAYFSGVPIKPSGPTSAESLDVTLFGEIDASLEDLSLAHTRNSVGGIFMKSGITSSVLLEQIVKSLVTEIHHAKVEKAKVQSVSKLLEEISANQHESKTLTERLPSLELYKTQTDTLVADLEQVRRELSLKDEQIAELEMSLKTQRSANAKLQEEIDHNTAASSLMKNGKPDSCSNDLNDNTNNDSSKHDTNANNTNNESSIHSKDADADDKRTLDSYRQREFGAPEQPIKRPTSPDLFSDPIHQLSQPSDISVLNLNSSHSTGPFSPTGKSHGPLSPFPGGTHSLANDSADFDSNAYTKHGSNDFQGSGKPRSLNENNDDGSIISAGNAESNTGKSADSLISHRSLSVPSSSPPSSPRFPLSEIRSLPQSPRALFGTGSATAGPGTMGSATSNSGSALAVPLSSHMHYTHQSPHTTLHNSRTSTLSPNLQSMSLAPSTPANKLSTRASSSSLKAAQATGSSRRNSTSSNSSNSQHSLKYKGSRKSIHSRQSNDDLAIASESEDDTSTSVGELKNLVKKLNEELNAAKGEMELLRERAVTAEKVAISRYRMKGDDDIVTITDGGNSDEKKDADQKGSDKKNEARDVVKELAKAAEKVEEVNKVENAEKDEKKKKTEKSEKDQSGDVKESLIKPLEDKETKSEIPKLAKGNLKNRKGKNNDVNNDRSNKQKSLRKGSPAHPAAKPKNSPPTVQDRIKNHFSKNGAVTIGVVFLGIAFMCLVSKMGAGDR